VGFPGETEDDLAVLCEFLEEARLDAVGVFGYSDEDRTEAAGLDGKHDPDEVHHRLDHVTRLADELTAQRAEDRVGEVVDVLVERVGPAPDDSSDAQAEGRAAHQGPDVDGSTSVLEAPDGLDVGDVVRAEVVSSSGADLTARALEVVA
jgi:ribosomal protein S12 methylthiotransferase